MSKTKLETAGGMFLLVASSDRFRGEKVPTLQEAVEECIKRQLTIYFDVKGHPDEVLTTVHYWWDYFLSTGFLKDLA